MLKYVDTFGEQAQIFYTRKNVSHGLSREAIRKAKYLFLDQVIFDTTTPHLMKRLPPQNF